MLTNERQRRVAGAQIERFEKAIAEAEAVGPAADVHPRLHQATIDGMRSQLADLEEEARAYDDLSAGRVRGRVLSSIGDLADALIEGRIAARLTQRELASRIDVSEQQVQRYEQTRYSSASFQRIQTVAAALQLTVGESIGYHVAAGGPPGAEEGREQTAEAAADAEMAASAAEETPGSEGAEEEEPTAG